jgi:cyclopropane-fatty-acyl-phospholipid synthase
VESATGVTLSRAQGAEIESRQIPGVSLFVTDFRDFEPVAPFDAVISICMMEHIATPEEARAGRHIDLYRDYFRRVHAWTTPGAWVSLQTIIRDRVPRDPQDLRDVVWVTRHIFPGGLSLRIEDVILSVGPYWEIMQMQTRREDYGKTCECWLSRLRGHEGHIRRNWGDAVFEDYERYLGNCVRSFARRYQSLAQFALKRIDSNWEDSTVMHKMSEREIRDTIGGVVARFAPRKSRVFQDASGERITLSALGLDSMAILELVMEIEKATGVTFDDHELVRIDDLVGLVRLVESKQGNKSYRSDSDARLGDDKW